MPYIVLANVRKVRKLTAEKFDQEHSTAVRGWLASVN